MEQFTFADVFAGIGGFHLGCAKNGGVCVQACEIDPVASYTYELNHRILPHDDVQTLMKPRPTVDLVCAGFPCQSHSTLGLRKAFKDPRGKLFDALVRYIETVRPTCFLLENVKGILSSNDGKSFARIVSSLESAGYQVVWCVLDSKNFRLPQHRERVYIVGHRNRQFDFSLLQKHKEPRLFRDIMDKRYDPTLACDIFDGVAISDPPRSTKSGFLLRAQLSNFTNRKLFSTDGIVGTIPTGSPPPIYDERHRVARHISVRELKLCQGFPAGFDFPKGISRSEAVKLVGNAVSVTVIDAIVKELLRQRLLRTRPGRP
jgi:DNA (cytosine-5)-methyltransferase 1